MFRLNTSLHRLAPVVFLTTWILQSQATAEVLTVSEPFVAPEGEYVTAQDRYFRFRIPGMIVAPDGSILVFAEGRRGDGSDPRYDENAPADLVMRRSTDNGASWEPMVVLDSGFRSNGMVDFGDPTPVLDVETKTIFVMYGQWPDKGPGTVKQGQSTDPADGHQTVWVRSSTDNGSTWSDRKQVIYPDEPNETSDRLYWRQAEPGPGNGIQLQFQPEESGRNGRLVIPAKRRGSRTPDGEARSDPFVFYSDDHGATWQVGRVTPGPDANEDEVVELTDGRLLLDARQKDGEHRRRHFSTDGGVTWSRDAPFHVPLTTLDASLIRYSAQRSRQGKDRLLFSCALGEDGLNRNNIAVWTSYDEGRTFINPVRFNKGFAAYSVLQRLADGTIGMVVETSASGKTNRYGAITFYRFDIAELETKRKRR